MLLACHTNLSNVTRLIARAWTGSEPTTSPLALGATTRRWLLLFATATESLDVSTYATSEISSYRGTATARTPATVSSISATPPPKRSALDVDLQANGTTATAHSCALCRLPSPMRPMTRSMKYPQSRTHTRRPLRLALRWWALHVPLLLVQMPAKPLWLMTLTLTSLGMKSALEAMCSIRSRRRCGALQIRRITAIACSLPSI